MTQEQYRVLLEYLDRKFEELDRHSTALSEQWRGELRIFAEGTDTRFH
jgi:hypothetical protein